MKRRALLRTIAGVVVARPLGKLRDSESAASQVASAPAASLSESDIRTLGAIAEVVLPAGIGRQGRDAAVTAFAAWVRNYREGADRGHGYGSSTLAAPTGPSPAQRYPPQFEALQQAARDRKAASFAALPLAARREVIEATLNQPQPVTRLPARPTGANLIADFMGLYFNGASAWDLAYRAEIGRDSCRGLRGSDERPRPLGSR